MNTRYSLLLVLLANLSLPTLAQNEDIFRNTALRSFQDSLSQTEVSVGYDYRHATTPIRLEQGDGHSRAFAQVDAYLHKGKATLWGKAQYSNGSTRNVQFCETSDFELLYPYLMADTVGGKTQQECYHFLGGFAYPLGRRWHIGAEGAYTALMEYRTRDPRPKNLSGDLKAQLAVSYRLGNEHDGYMLGFAMDARKYKQTNEVKLYNEASVPTIYHLTGLGYDYYRFRGMNTSTYYKGYGVGGMLDWTRVNQRGWFVHAEYSFLDIDKIISTLNELPMANIKEYQEKVVFGYRVGNDRNIFGWNLAEEWIVRRGRENIFGTAQDNVYPQISTMAPYCLDRARFSTELAYRHIFPSKSEIAVRGTARWDGWEEWYEQGDDDPTRDMEGDAWVLGLHLSGKLNTRHWQWLAQLAGEYQINTFDYLNWKDENVNQTLLTPVLHYYDYLSNDRQFVTAQVEAGYTKDKRFTPFVRIGWNYAHYRVTAHQNQLMVAVGVKF